MASKHYRRGTVIDQFGAVRYDNGKLVAAPNRVRLLKKAVSEQEVKEALYTFDTEYEAANLLGINQNDLYILKIVYGIGPSRQPVAVETSEPTVSHQPVDLDVVAERVLSSALAKIDSVLEARVKVVVAKALHDAAQAILTTGIGEKD